MTPDDERNQCGYFIGTDKDIERVRKGLYKAKFKDRLWDALEPLAEKAGTHIKHQGALLDLVSPVEHNDWSELPPEEKPRDIFSPLFHALHLVVYPGLVTAVHCEPHDGNPLSIPGHYLMWKLQNHRDLDGSFHPLLNQLLKTPLGVYTDYRLGTIMFLNRVRRYGPSFMPSPSVFSQGLR